MKNELLAILGKYKVIGDTTYGLGYEEAEKLAEEIINEAKNYWYHAGHWHKAECDFILSDRGVCNCHNPKE